MKKLLLTFALMLTTLATWAQRWTAPTEYDYPSSTVINFMLRVDDVNVTNSNSAPSYEIGAFINGECRGKATFIRGNNIAGTKATYRVRVWHTDAEANSTIELKVFCPDNVVYKLGETVVADKETHSLGTKNLYTVKGINVPNPVVIEQKNIEGATYDVLAETSLTFNGNEPGDFAIDEDESPVSYVLDSKGSNYYYIGQQNEIVAMSETPATGEPLNITATVPSHGKNVPVAQAETTVIIRKAVVLVTSIATSKDYYEVNVGDAVYEMILSNITVLPADASNKGLNIICTDVAATDPFANGVAQTPGTYTLEVSAVAATDECNKLTITVKVLEPVKIVLANAQEEIVLSKLSDKVVNLVVTGDNFDPTKVEVNVFAEAGVPATATLAADGKSITMRGLIAGEDHTLEVKYDGDGQIATTFSVDEEVTFANGWDWVAPAALPAEPGYLTINENGAYASWLNQDANNKIIEIRSQTALLYNDPEYGLFGDINQLTFADGMYKIKAQYADASKAVLNLGHQLTFAAWHDGKQVKKGYTWIGYPFQDARPLTEVGFFLDGTASVGDLIIGKTGFAEYTAGGWVSTANFTFEPNKGYIYYTENEEPFIPFFGYETREYAAKPARTMAKTFNDDFQYDATQFADNMPIVAQLDGLYNASECVIGAFVGDECRGRGVFVDDNKAYISVAGKAGEQVTFRLYDNETGNYYDISETVNYGMRAGSHDAPVMLSSGVATGIGCISNTTANTADENVYDLAGRRVNNAAKGIFISNGKKIIK